MKMNLFHVTRNSPLKHRRVVCVEKARLCFLRDGLRSPCTTNSHLGIFTLNVMDFDVMNTEELQCQF